MELIYLVTGEMILMAFAHFWIFNFCDSFAWYWGIGIIFKTQHYICMGYDFVKNFWLEGFCTFFLFRLKILTFLHIALSSPKDVKMLVLSEDTKCAGNDSWKCEKIVAKFGSFIFTDIIFVMQQQIHLDNSLRKNVFLWFGEKFVANGNFYTFFSHFRQFWSSKQHWVWIE